jgi:hypothetical protein
MSIITLSIDLPWLLKSVIANPGDIGICFLVKVNPSTSLLLSTGYNGDRSLFREVNSSASIRLCFTRTKRGGELQSIYCRAVRLA